MATITGLEGGWTKEKGPGREQPRTAECRRGVLLVNLFSPKTKLTAVSQEQATQSETFEPPTCTQKMGRVDFIL